MSQRTVSESQIFRAAVKLSEEDRARYLDDACHGDQRLRAEVESLLGAHDPSRSFLYPPAAAITLDRTTPEPVGTLIGPYKLLEQIGEGGMGLVYMAEQQQPVRRLVALKLVKPGMDSKQVIARFEAERQALAMMDHPNIAKVHDAGTTETGRPYFVMELVRGIPLNEFCDQKRLAVRERLQLFVQVCQSVQHAHQKGIIHRDLKPTNVLVAMADTVAFPKLLDFGIAKALGQSLTDNTLHTGYSQLVGTPLYMSPEQAEMNVFGVDTRSDIYSLGVLLYELLTGTTPFDNEQLTKANFDEMRRMIREDEPPCPSARMSTFKAQALSTISQQRNVEPRRISATLRGELDWIVIKALNKDRSRRYESASAFAADIQRYLSDEPVLACPPTAMYRFQKFARKHKPALATVAIIAACLILGTSVSAWQAVRATTAEAEAIANEQKAVANEQKAEANAASAQQSAQHANQQRDEAQRQRDEVKALADKLAAKEQQLQRTLYASNLNLAQHAWDAGSIWMVNELLAQHRPKPGDADLRGFEWHYLYRLCHADLLTIKGTRRVLVYSPDGKRLASRGKVFDSQTGQDLLDLKGSGVSFSPDGKRLAGTRNRWDGTKNAYFDHEVKVWDAHTGQELLSFPVQEATGLEWWGVVFSPDGKRLASVGSCYTQPSKLVPAEVRVWDALTGKELLTLKGLASANLNLAFSPDGKHLARPGDDSVKVWDAHTGQELLSLQGHCDNVSFSPDSRLLIGAGFELKVWDVQTGREVPSPIHSGRCVAYSPDGKRLATGARDGAVKVWDAESGQELFSFKGHTDEVTAVAFRPDGTRLASASSDGTVKVWDATANPGPRTLSSHTGSVSGVILSPDGKRVAGVSRDPATMERAVVVWDAQTGQELLKLRGNHYGRGSLAFSPDGKRLAGISQDPTTKERSVKVWDAQTGQELHSLNHGGSSAAFSPDGKRLATGSGTSEVKVWDAQSGQELLSLKGNNRLVTSLTFSPDGKRLAALARATIKVWDTQTGLETITLSVQSFYRGSVAFSPDGKRLASSSNLSAPSEPQIRTVGEVKVWDAQTGEEIFSLKGHTAQVTAVAFSPDGKRLVSGSSGLPAADAQGGGQAGELKVWDAQTGQELLTLQGAGYHDSVSFSPNGHVLASDIGGKVTMWDATPLPEKP
jgi:eukaryotic-like serine/threonine-protein kinase